MNKLILLKPFFSERLWGGRKLKKIGFKIPDNKRIGEAWLISALDNGMTYIINDEFKGMALKTFYQTYPELFQTQSPDFPLLTKIISTNDYLSIQVHPDDDYSLKHNQMLGKPECWYIIDCPKDAEIIYGHTAQTKVDLKKMIFKQQWEQLWQKVKIKPGDFIYVPPGKVHAISPNVTLFELQTASDVTYRIYDFNRRDANGNLRVLHIDKCLDVITVPDHYLPVVHKKAGILIDNEFFTMHLIKSDQVIDTTKIKWLQITVLEGEVIIANHKLLCAQSALLLNLSAQVKIKVEKGVAIISYKKVTTL